MDNLLMFLQDENLNKRYYTLLDTIKSASNSFFDVYNSLIENILKKCILDRFDEKATGSTYTIINKYRDYFSNEIKMNDLLINKILDYAQKINKHKHSSEKDISFELVVKYYNVLYSLVYKIALYYKFTIPKMDESYLESIYNTLVQSDDTNKTVNEINEKLDIILEPKLKDIKRRQIVENYNRIGILLTTKPKEVKTILDDEQFKAWKLAFIILTILTTILGYSLYIFILSVNNGFKNVTYFNMFIQLLFFIYGLYLIFIPKYIKNTKLWLISSDKHYFSNATLIISFIYIMSLFYFIATTFIIENDIFKFLGILNIILCFIFPIVGYIFFRFYKLGYHEAVPYIGYFNGNHEISKEEFDSYK